ncbi:MAG: DUF4124 domain-containing protein [Gammaproteobacteria bacterium]|nr:DUF4124 domain-containing protein [Gammaproteobacteria bacterium]
MGHLILGVVLLLAAVPLHAAVYKCNVDGVMVFSDQRCASNAERIKVRAAYSPDPQNLTPGISHHDLLRNADRRAAISRKQVSVGMSPSDVTAAWGRPDRVNVSGGISGRQEQWVYLRSRQRSQYIYFNAGRVTAWN